MLSVSFGYNGSTILLPYLASGACHYTTVAIRETTVSKETDLPAIEEFLEKQDRSLYIGLVYNLRVPAMDSPDVLNGIAYTCIGLQFIDPPKKYRWMHLRHTLSSLQKLREYSEIPSFLLDYIETKIWKHLGSMKQPVCRVLNKLILHVSLEVAEKLYHPDYVWKTGPHKGKKTMNILLEKSGLPTIA